MVLQENQPPASAKRVPYPRPRSSRFGAEFLRPPLQARAEVSLNKQPATGGRTASPRARRQVTKGTRGENFVPSSRQQTRAESSLRKQQASWRRGSQGTRPTAESAFEHLRSVEATFEPSRDRHEVEISEHHSPPILDTKNFEDESKWRGQGARHNGGSPEPRKQRASSTRSVNRSNVHAGVALGSCFEEGFARQLSARYEKTSRGQSKPELCFLRGTPSGLAHQRGTESCPQQGLSKTSIFSLHHADEDGETNSAQVVSESDLASRPPLEWYDYAEAFENGAASAGSSTRGGELKSWADNGPPDDVEPDYLKQTNAQSSTAKQHQDQRIEFFPVEDDASIRAVPSGCRHNTNTHVYQKGPLFRDEVTTWDEEKHGWQEIAARARYLLNRETAASEFSWTPRPETTQEGVISGLPGSQQPQYIHLCQERGPSQHRPHSFDIGSTKASCSSDLIPQNDFERLDTHDSSTTSPSTIKQAPSVSSSTFRRRVSSSSYRTADAFAVDISSENSSGGSRLSLDKDSSDLRSEQRVVSSRCASPSTTSSSTLRIYECPADYSSTAVLTASRNGDAQPARLSTVDPQAQSNGSDPPGHVSEPQNRSGQGLLPVTMPDTPTTPQRPRPTRHYTSPRQSPRTNQPRSPYQQTSPTTLRAHGSNRRGDHLHSNIALGASPDAGSHSRPRMPASLPSWVAGSYDEGDESTMVGSNTYDPIVRDFSPGQHGRSYGHQATPLPSPVVHRRNRHTVEFPTDLSFAEDGQGHTAVAGDPIPFAERAEQSASRDRSGSAYSSPGSSRRGYLTEPRPYPYVTAESAPVTPSGPHGHPTVDDGHVFGSASLSAPPTGQSELRSFFSDDTSDMEYRASCGYKIKELFAKLCPCCMKRRASVFETAPAQEDKPKRSSFKLFSRKGKKSTNPAGGADIALEEVVPGRGRAI